MISDLFDAVTCRTCGEAWRPMNTPFRRLMSLEDKSGLSFLCECRMCGTLFVIYYAGQEP